MTRALAVLVLCCLRGAPGVDVQDPVEVARHFLPANAQLAELYTFNYQAGRVDSKFPAVLTGHVLSPGSTDIVFAYYSPRVNVLEKTLFITLLHRTGPGYEKEYELAYRSEVLLAPRAIQILRLEGQPTHAVAVVHGMGASLGGQIEILRWEEPWGWRNIFPPNSSVHYFTVGPDQGRVKVRLGYGKAVDAETPPPDVYAWDGKRFVKE